MASLRIETLADAGSGMIYVELFHEPGDEPVIVSDPIYRTHEEARDEITRVLKGAWPNVMPLAIDPTIGV